MNTRRVASFVRFALPALVLVLAACAAKEHRVHGADDFEGPPVTVSELLASPADFEGRTIVVSGTVAEVCRNKGCWMLLRDGEREVRVVFKDYAFFVPTNCDGETVEVKGVFKVKEVPAAQAAHYLEDAGKHAEAEAAAAAGPAPGFMLIATGARFPVS